MRDINKAIIIGRLGSDPIQRQTKSGTSVVHFSVATTRRFSKESPESPNQSVQVEDTQWHRIVTWGKQAETCHQYLKKGNSVYIEGVLKTHQYEDKNGVNRTSTEIHSEVISFLGSSNSERNLRSKIEVAELKTENSTEALVST